MYIRIIYNGNIEGAGKRTDLKPGDQSVYHYNETTAAWEDVTLNLAEGGKLISIIFDNRHP